VTTRPVSTTEGWGARQLSRLAPLPLVLLVTCQGCQGSLWRTRRSAGPTGVLGARENRQEPALSGGGQWLASLVDRGGTPTVFLQEQPSGRAVPLPHLRRFTPHRSPSLSWNGRYLALLAQQGPRRLAMVEDRATGHLHRLQLPMGLEPERLSLAPDGRRLAVATVERGRPQVRVFDLTGLLEPDPPPGQAVGGSVTEAEKR